MDRPRNPRQYRRRKKSLSRYPTNPAQKHICTTMPPIEQTRADYNPAYDPTLLYAPAAPPEETIVQIKIESESSWGLEAEDFGDFNPYIIEVKQEPDLGDEPIFEWVVIKQEQNDSQGIVPNCTVKLLAIKQEIKTKLMEPHVRNNQEEIESHEPVSECYLSAIKNEPLETIPESDGDIEENSIKQKILNLGDITSICVDDSVDEPPSIGESTEYNCPSIIKHEPLEILDYGDMYPEPPLINMTGTQKTTHVYGYGHTCVPQRIYPYRFLKQFFRNTCHRGYSIQAVRLLNGNKNQFTNTYHCDNCNQRYTNLDLIKDHVLTHNLHESKRYPQFYETTDCKICFQRNIDRLYLENSGTVDHVAKGEKFSVRLHLERKHSERVFKAAKGQKFSVRVECAICRRLFTTYECLECGEKYDRSFGLNWHTQMHRDQRHLLASSDAKSSGRRQDLLDDDDVVFFS